MAPKFESYSNFEAIHNIEACGPTNFVPGDVSARIIRIRIKQEGRPPAVYQANVGAAPPIDAAEPMWEIVFDRGQLVAGPARAQGEAVVFRADGTTKVVTWASDVVLVEPTSFVTFGEVDPDASIANLIEGIEPS